MKKTVLIFCFVLGFLFSGFAQKAPQNVPLPNQKQTEYVRYFPNPATTNINFEFENGLQPGTSILVYNLMGKEVMNIKKLSVFTNISLQNLYRGVYIFKLLDDKGRMLQSGKFQIIR